MLLKCGTGGIIIAAAQRTSSLLEGGGVVTYAELEINAGFY
jgi:hypothetical protein